MQQSDKRRKWYKVKKWTPLYTYPNRQFRACLYPMKVVTLSETQSFEFNTGEVVGNCSIGMYTPCY